MLNLQHGVDGALRLGTPAPKLTSSFTLEYQTSSSSSSSSLFVSLHTCVHRLVCFNIFDIYIPAPEHTHKTSGTCTDSQNPVHRAAESFRLKFFFKRHFWIINVTKEDFYSSFEDLFVFLTFLFSIFRHFVFLADVFFKSTSLFEPFSSLINPDLCLSGACSQVHVTR